MSYKLVKFEKDYADEFSVYGMRIMTTKELDEYLLEAKNTSYPDEHYFGTNEAIKFNTFDDVVNSLEIIDISDVSSVIKNVLGNEFGWFPDFGDY